LLLPGSVAFRSLTSLSNLSELWDWLLRSTIWRTRRLLLCYQSRTTQSIKTTVWKLCVCCCSNGFCL